MPPANIAAAVSGGFLFGGKMFTRIRAIQKELRSARVNNNELEGLRKGTAKLQRKTEHQGKHLLGLVSKNQNLRYEIKKLEDTLAWIHRTEQPIEEIRAVIEKTISKRLKNETR